jgi:hypothetical protein
MGKTQYRTIGSHTVGSILFKGMLVEFVFDTSDEEEFEIENWKFKIQIK